MELPQLKAYGVKLLGSLVGKAWFTLLAFLYTPPWVWLMTGFLLLVPFFMPYYRSLLILIFALIVAAVGYRNHAPCGRRIIESRYGSMQRHVVKTQRVQVEC